MIFSPEVGLDPGKLLDAMGWGYGYQRGRTHSAIQIGEARLSLTRRGSILPIAGWSRFSFHGPTERARTAAQLLLHGGRPPASVGNADSIPGREG